MIWAKKPRVGQYVRLRSGEEALVISVRQVNDLLRECNEIQAATIGSKLRSKYGLKWQRLYFEAAVSVDGKPHKNVTLGDIETTLDKWL